MNQVKTAFPRKAVLLRCSNMTFPCGKPQQIQGQTSGFLLLPQASKNYSNTAGKRILCSLSPHLCNPNAERCSFNPDTVLLNAWPLKMSINTFMPLSAVILLCTSLKCQQQQTPTPYRCMKDVLLLFFLIFIIGCNALF